MVVTQIISKWRECKFCKEKKVILFDEYIYSLNSLMTSGGAHIQSPIASMFAAAKRYHIDDAINAFMRNDNAIGMYVEAKMMVKRVVWKNEYERWKASCLLYKELSFYMVAVNRISIHPWWKLAKIQAITFKSYRVCDIGVVWRSTKGFTKKNETINLPNMWP